MLTLFLRICTAKYDLSLLCKEQSQVNVDNEKFPILFLHLKH